MGERRGAVGQGADLVPVKAEVGQRKSGEQERQAVVRVPGSVTSPQEIPVRTFCPGAPCWMALVPCCALSSEGAVQEGQCGLSSNTEAD